MDDKIKKKILLIVFVIGFAGVALIFSRGIVKDNSDKGNITNTDGVDNRKSYNEINADSYSVEKNESSENNSMDNKVPEKSHYDINTSQKSTTEEDKKYMEKYDEGYNAIYDDEDYDVDRYAKDRDYANGVDDAMEDAEEDWGDEW